MAELVVFHLDELRIALMLAAVERVVSAVQITRLLETPDIVLGVVNVRSRVIPVIDARKRFRLPPREIAPSDRFVIAHTARRPVALVADAVSGIIQCPEQDIVGSDGVLPGMEYVDGVVKLGDGLILIHNLDGFLSLEEEDSLDRALSTNGGR